MTQFELQGHDAYCEGKKEKHCPYRGDPQKREQWLNGWAEAKRVSKTPVFIQKQQGKPCNRPDARLIFTGDPDWYYRIEETLLTEEDAVEEVMVIYACDLEEAKRYLLALDTEQEKP